MKIKPMHAVHQFVLFLSLAGIACAQAQVRLPDTPSGHIVADYIQAFNSGDEQAVRTFLQNNLADDSLRQRPLDQRMAMYQQMRSDLQSIKLREVSEVQQSASGSSITILADAKSGDSLTMSFEFAPQPPNKLLGIRIQRGAGLSAEAAGPPLTQDEVLTSMTKLLEEQVQADQFSGVVLLAKNGAPVFEKAYGLASKEYNAPNLLDTKFNLGSINKIFTEVAIGQLAQQGKLSYDDTLGKLLPDYPNKEAAAKVTIRELLNMTSGIGDFFGEQYQNTSKNKLRTIADYLPLFDTMPLAFAPGTAQRYSNGGYIVLGAIIERVSGQSYYDYVHDHIFKIAGMSDTGYFPADMPTPNLASGYTHRGDIETSYWRNNIYTRPAVGSSAGGGYSTARDLLRFTLALQRGTLLLPDMENPGTQRSASRKGIGIAGGAPGVNAAVEDDPVSGYTLIVLANYDPPTAESIISQVRQWLHRIKHTA